MKAESIPEPIKVLIDFSGNRDHVIAQQIKIEVNTSSYPFGNMSNVNVFLCNFEEVFLEIMLKRQKKKY